MGRGAGITAQPSRAVPLAGSLGLIARPLREPVLSRQLSLFTRKGAALSTAAQSLQNLALKELAR